MRVLEGNLVKFVSADQTHDLVVDIQTGLVSRRGLTAWKETAHTGLARSHPWA